MRLTIWQIVFKLDIGYIGHIVLSSTEFKMENLNKRGKCWMITVIFGIMGFQFVVYQFVDVFPFKGERSLKKLRIILVDQRSQKRFI